MQVKHSEDWLKHLAYCPVSAVAYTIKLMHVMQEKHNAVVLTEMRSSNDWCISSIYSTAEFPKAPG